MKIRQATLIAGDILETILPYCREAKVVGSVRRQKPEVGDIELIVKPNANYKNDLFGQISETTYETEFITTALVEAGAVYVKGAERLRVFDLPEGIRLELYICIPPSQWGMMEIIRTGPASFSHAIVTQRKYGGLLPSFARVKDNNIWTHGDGAVETPTEKEVFKFLGIEYIHPTARENWEDHIKRLSGSFARGKR